MAIYANEDGDEVYMYFKDVRDSVNAMRYIKNKAHYHLQLEPSPIEVVCIAAQQFVQNSLHLQAPFNMDFLPKTFRHGFDGQVLVKASFVADQKILSDWGQGDWMEPYVTRRAMEFIRNFGDIKVIVPVGDHHSQPTLIFHVEMYHNQNADRMVSYTEVFAQGWLHEVSVEFSLPLKSVILESKPPKSAFDFGRFTTSRMPVSCRPNRLARMEMKIDAGSRNISVIVSLDTASLDKKESICIRDLAVRIRIA